MLEGKKIYSSTPQDTKNRANRRVGPVFVYLFMAYKNARRSL